MKISLVIRTLNEATYLDDLLTAVARQTLTEDHSVEVVVIDSGSTDGTVKIATRMGARITTITREEFTFGRSLNRGCDFATGDILVFISGHCIPTTDDWLQHLCAPLIDGVASYSYGRQIGTKDTNFAEERIFAKYFPAQSAIPQDGFFCNNANSAILTSAWAVERFDEELTGLEDMALAKVLHGKGHKIAYVAEAPVYHIHNETWAQVRRRFEREALALQSIMPEIQINWFDMLRYIVHSIATDLVAAPKRGNFARRAYQILRYRVAQYAGSYIGNREHRQISKAQKEAFFFPTPKSR